MTDDFPRICPGGWSLESLKQHWEMVDELKEKLVTERDRRYAEVNIEREKALKIKEEADKAALGLAREIQTYKDEKANELREQINSERGLYTTKDELAAAVREITAQITPLSAFMASYGGERHSFESSRTNVIAVAATSSALAAVTGVILTLLVRGFVH